MTNQQMLAARTGRLVEAVGNAGKNVWRIRIISAGEGSSAFYPAEVLERDGRRAFPLGTKIYMNHPSMSENWDRPERDAEKIVGKIVSIVEYDETDQSLYCEVEFSDDPKFVRYLEQFHDVLGMSIYAYAEFDEFVTIGEYTGDVVTHLLESPLNSVDIVTVPGANGAILKRVSEGYKAFATKGTKAPTAEATATNPQPEGQKLDKELSDALGALPALVAEAVANALAPKTESPSEDAIGAGLELVAESGLPKEARAVAYKAIREGAKPEEAIATQKTLVESIKAAVQAEADAANDNAGGRPLAESAGDITFRGYGGK
jgi:hypothetical protein